MKILIKLVLAAVGLWPLLPLQAASCTPTMNEAVVNFNNYSITDFPSMPAGSQLSGSILGQENRSFFNCPAGTGPVTMVFKENSALHVAGASGIAPNGSGGAISLYDINGIPGAGFAVGIRETTHCAGDPVHYIASGAHQTAVCSTGDPSQMATQFYVTFFKTAQNISLEQPNSGQIQAGHLILTDSAGNDISGGGILISVAAADLKVHQASCYVSDNNISVDMGQTSVGAFNNATAGDKHRFTIPLICEPNQNKAVKIGFFGQATDGDRDALALTGSSDSATGVGIQISYGDNYGSAADQVVPLNSTGVSAFPDSAGKNHLELDYNARYVKTGPHVTPGRADSLATFSIIYN